MNERPFGLNRGPLTVDAAKPQRTPMLLVLLDELEKECAINGEVSEGLTTQLEPLLEIMPECPPNPKDVCDPRPTLPNALERLRTIGDVVRRTNSLLRDTRRRLEV